MNTINALSRNRAPLQAAPGEEEESRGLPDASIFDAGEWALLIEAKVQAGVDVGQLRRHISTAQRHGYVDPHLLLLCVDKPPQGLPERTTCRAWRDLYQWLRTHDGSQWARRLAEYFEVFEARMVGEDYSIRGTLTMFDGLRFDADKPYTYREGKRLIRLLGDELQARKDLHAIGIDPKGERRSAITGSGQDGVWDLLPLEVSRRAKSFTDFPHFSMWLGRDNARAAVTVPNGVKGGFRTRLREAGEAKFTDLLLDVESGVRSVVRRSKNARPMVYATQRHFRSQRSVGIEDAKLIVDLRTTRKGQRREAKYQPEWVRAIYEALANKRSNIQFGVEIHFSYECPIVRSSKAIDLFAASWVAMSPLVDFVLDRRKREPTS